VLRSGKQREERGAGRMPSSHSSERKANRADHRSDDVAAGDGHSCAVASARGRLCRTVPTRTDVANIS
jgi:hypothetical protein